MIEKSVIDIVTLAERELHQSAGMSVQVYSQDQLAQNVQNGFNFFFDDNEHRWKKFEVTTVYTLDGVTGRTTVPIKTIYPHYEDILKVYPGTSTRQLANWIGGNPAAVTGGYPLFYTTDTTDTLRVIPSSAAGQITVVGKARPAEFNITSVVPFDYMCLMYFAAWQYMVDDGTNPAAEEKLRNLFEQRYKQMKQNSSREPIRLSGGYGDIPMSWRDEC